MTNFRRAYINLRGATRVVIVLRHYVIKIPTFKSWKLFLHGLLANLQERQMSTINDAALCPVISGSRIGLFVIMPRCEPVNHRGLFFTELCRLKIRGKLPEEFYLRDAKPENFGYLKCRLVKLDYGE